MFLIFHNDNNKTFVESIQILHEKYVCEILHQARAILKSLPNFNHVDLSNLHHVFIVGDLHGQLADLLHIFNSVRDVVIKSIRESILSFLLFNRTDCHRQIMPMYSMGILLIVVEIQLKSFYYFQLHLYSIQAQSFSIEVEIKSIL